MPKHKSVQKVAVERQLIEFVKDKPAIFQKMHAQHLDAIFIANQWKSIFQAMEPNQVATSVSASEKLWGSLWSQSLAHKRKLNGKTGDGCDKRPYFRHEEAMRFSDDKQHVEMNENEGPSADILLVNDVNPDDDSSPNSFDVSNTAISSSSITSLPIETPCNTRTHINKTHGFICSKGVVLNISFSKRKEKDFDEKLFDILASQSPTMDEYEAFATAIAMKLRKLDPQKSSEAQFLMHQVLYNMEKDA